LALVEVDSGVSMLDVGEKDRIKADALDVVHGSWRCGAQGQQGRTLVRVPLMPNVTAGVKMNS